MPIIFAILITLVWLTPALAGTITMNFELNGTRCVITNRGDSAAYYPLLLQLERNGQWLPLNTATQPAELLPGGKLAVDLASSTATDKADISGLQAVMIRFFDQAGVSFGQIAVLRSPPPSDAKISVGYAKNHLKLTAPPQESKILATWLLAPLEEGIRPLLKPQQFTHPLAPAVRIDWNGRKNAEIATGVTRPAVILVHETTAGLSLQKVQYNGPKRYEQRTGWLTIRTPLYGVALLCAVCGILLCNGKKKERLP